ncbi:BTAD domain-containing putative transcriptional regulator [Actinoplanes sp. NPDC051494]|uniref:BTAD domain-containing putative transcriptional regulator n=1 Tax=Actinoplanes sp. NPDC051494 TaxID=3363907 RepID=UPI003790604F
MVVVTTFRVLGAIAAATSRGSVDLKGARPRAVLARLLIARGRVVPVDRLVEDLWDVPPDGAVAAIRTFVAGLRRALEPDRPARQTPSLLVTVPPGYALHVAADAVDAWRFEDLVASAAGLPAAGVQAVLGEALELWQGPAFAEYAGQAWARSAIDRLDELRMLAVERRASALLELGRAEEAVPGLQAQVAAQPLREDAWHLLVTALYRGGRQGEALAALRRARSVLAEELGVDPGPRLKQLEADVLAQAPHLSGPPVERPLAAPPMVAPPMVARPLAAPPMVARPPDRPFVGRGPELAALADAAREAMVRGRPVLALIAGEAGAGKSALAEALSHRLGWATVWGRSPEHEGAPVDWPWSRGQQLTTGPEPVLVVADDLHRADGDSLDLLTALLTDPGAGAALVVGTYRPAEVGDGLGGALARFARAEPLRVRLDGLSADEVGDLIGTVAGRDPGAGVARAVHRRSGGNPFFARELARLYVSGAALGDIPDGVRDVIRHRLTLLPQASRGVLRRASVLGRDVDAEVLAVLAGEDVLDDLEAALRAGFLTEGPLRFTHVLVRDTLYDDLSALRRTRWHAGAAAALEKVRPDDAAALAHHHAQAGHPEAARYAAVAATRAEQRHNPHEAARLWRQALATDEFRDRLTAVMGLGRSLAVIGRLAETRALRAEAIGTAVALGDRELLTHVLTAFDVPAIWPRNDDEELSRRIVTAVETALPGAPPALRSRLLSTLALEMRGDTGTRGRAAALEAESLARGGGDPALLAAALNARFMHTFERPGRSRERARIGAELIDLASRHGLVVFGVLGHLISLQSACAVGDVTRADEHAAAADRIAAEYDLPMVAVFTALYAALREPSEQAYRSACERLTEGGMPGVADGLLSLALLSLGHPDGELGHPDGELGHTDGELGPYEPWARPGILLAAGHRDEAAAALRALPESPHDLMWEARLWLAGRAAVALGDREMMAALYDELLPAGGELAGAAGGVLSFGPVSDLLEELTT